MRRYAPTFRYVDGVWYSTRFKDLHKGDIMRTFNTSQDYHDGRPVVFHELKRYLCTSEPSQITVEGKHFVDGTIPEGTEEMVWGVDTEEVDPFRP